MKFFVRRLVAPAALLLALGILAIGCSRLPSAPVTPTSAEWSASTAGDRVAEPAGLIGGVFDLLKGLIVRTLNLVGSLGGTLTNARWMLTIPPNAVEGSATVAIGVPSSTSSSCQLEIYPLEKNHFAVPVLLTVDCRSVTSDALKTYSIFWWDPAKRVWVPVPGSKVDLTRKTVTAPLSHFSKYSVGPLQGKAGW